MQGQAFGQGAKFCTFALSTTVSLRGPRIAGTHCTFRPPFADPTGALRISIFQFSENIDQCMDRKHRSQSFDCSSVSIPLLETWESGKSEILIARLAESRIGEFGAKGEIRGQSERGGLVGNN